MGVVMQEEEIKHWTARRKSALVLEIIQGKTTVGNPPAFNRLQKWSYAASTSFCIGVMPPSAMFGRS